MKHIDNLNEICNRTNEELILKNFLIHFYKDVPPLTSSLTSSSIKEMNETQDLNEDFKKGLYIYGDTGTGKTQFVLNFLKNNNYDIIYYNSSDIRNKSVIDTITKYNMSDKSILSLLQKKVKRPVIVMDEIDGMILGDKGGINSLIKLIRPKKTKKQKNEDHSLNPIICIGNYQTDKKIKELIKVCNTIELKKITNEQIHTLIDEFIPHSNINTSIKQNIILYVEGNLRKLINISEIYNNDYFKKQQQNHQQNPSTINTIENNNSLFQHILHSNSYKYNINNILVKILNNHYPFSEHIKLINETDRTTMGLNFHENIIDFLDTTNIKNSISFYLQFLENICFSDYIDRITFQKQIWQFNEMSSLIKTFKNNNLLHNNPFHIILHDKIKEVTPKDIRFTKVLTKYSSEYNNYIFIQNLCQQLMIDKKDLFSFFSFLKIKYNNDINLIINLFSENYDITKLDIQRIYKYIDKTIKDIKDNKEDNLKDNLKDNIFDETLEITDCD